MKWWDNLFLNEGFAEFWYMNAAAYTFPEQASYVVSLKSFAEKSSELRNGDT